jgi:hypothetical protein
MSKTQLNGSAGNVEPQRVTADITSVIRYQIKHSIEDDQ